MNLEIGERDKLILDTVIDYYIAYASPIGSRTLSKKIDGHLSPATIRNIMADLEDIGLLQHLHTSAGRIPTDKGYRYYVDTLLKRHHRNKRGKNTSQIELSVREREELMEEVSRRLSTLSRYVGVILTPKITALRMKHMDFILLSSDKILIVFISQTGWVYNKIIEIRESFSQEELDLVNKYINIECKNLTLSEIRSKLKKTISEERRLYKTILDNLGLLSEEMDKKHSEDCYLQGHSNLLKHPEFTDPGRVKSLFKTLEEKIKIVRLLDKCIDQEGISVTIGSENEVPEIQSCSVVMTNYCMDESTKGALGIIGPTRMRYTEVINLIDNTAIMIERLFQKELI